jgi:dsDNA-specific endonuclease/ATPase MutS2
MTAPKSLLRRVADWLLGPPPPRAPAPETGGEEESPAGEPLPDLDDVVQTPIEDAIDLHTFAPRDVASVVEEYLREARARGFREVRVIHGKGKGVQRRIVQGVLARHADVESFRDAPASRGGWGATIVALKPRAPQG